MKTKMEYIILKKHEKTVFDKKKNTLILHLKDSPFKIIEKTFSNVKSDDYTEEILNIKSEYIGTLEYNNIIIEFSLKEYAKQSLEYLTVIINEKSKINILVLEEIDRILQEAFEKQNYIFITSFDSISEYYCNKIYKKLNNFERKLRQLMFNIYTFSYGIKYYDITFNNDTKNKIKQRKDKSIVTTTKEIEVLKQSLYQIEYQDIINLLFIQKWNEKYNKNKEKLVELLKENDTSNQVINEIKNIGPKSDWQRLFEPIIGNIENLEELLDEIRHLRNKVAHCKFFRRNEYEKCSKILIILNKNIEKSIKTTMSLNFMDLNMKYLLESSERCMKVLTDTFSTITKSVFKIFNEIDINTLNPIYENLKNIYVPLKMVSNFKTIENSKILKRKKYKINRNITKDLLNNNNEINYNKKRNKV